MKTGFRQQRIFLVLFILYILSGCSSNLSRDEAKDSIIRSLRLPSYRTMDINKIYIKSYSSSGWTVCLIYGDKYDDVKSNLLYAMSEGAIVITENGPLGQCNIVQAVISLTDAGKQYLIREYTKERDDAGTSDVFEVKTCDIVFGEITGIIQNKESNFAEVRYTLEKKNISPFGKAFGVKPEIINRTAMFTKYDDGWRINE